MFLREREKIRPHLAFIREAHRPPTGKDVINPKLHSAAPKNERLLAAYALSVNFRSWLIVPVERGRGMPAAAAYLPLAVMNY